MVALFPALCILPIGRGALYHVGVQESTLIEEIANVMSSESDFKGVARWIHLDGQVPVMVLVVVIVLLVLLGNIFGSRSPKRAKPEYRYRARTSVMSAREEEFYHRLTAILGPRYLVFPQMHLSALLDWHIKGQNWNAARSSINGKSVDYAVVEADTLQLLCAIELDDHTHDRPDRVERDRLVERIFSSAGLPLVRFRDVERMSDSQVRDAVFSHMRRM